MNKETKESMAVRQHMEAASNAADAFYRKDDENRAVFQILVERENKEDLGTTGCLYAGCGSLLTLGIDNAIDNCEGFRKSLILALGRRNPILGMLLAKMLDSNEGEGGIIMDKKREISATEQERIELAQKIQNWVNENPSERVCICILGSGDISSAVVVGSHKLLVEFTASALNTEDSKVREIIMESLILAAASKMSRE